MDSRVYQTKVEQIAEMRALASQWVGFVDINGRSYQCHADRWNMLADKHQAQYDKDQKGAK